MHTKEIALGGYVASLLKNESACYPVGVEYVRERRNGSGTIITFAVDATGADTIRENLTRRCDPNLGHSKDQRHAFAKVVASLPTFETAAPEPTEEVEAPAPAPVMEATIEAEIVPAANESAPIIDAELVTIRVRTTLRLFWSRLPTLRGADLDATTTEVVQRLMALAADSADIATMLANINDAGYNGSEIFHALVLRSARDVGDNRPAKPAKKVKPKGITLERIAGDAKAKADAAQQRLDAALAADPKARNIAALKAVATKLRREAGIAPVQPVRPAPAPLPVW